MIAQLPSPSPMRPVPPPPSSRRSIWRKAAVIAAVVLAVVLAGLIGFLMLKYAGDASQASSTLRSLRPWFISGQLVALGLLWHFWAGFVAWLARSRGMPKYVEQAVVQARGRIFVLLGACELLIVLRALFG